MEVVKEVPVEKLVEVEKESCLQFSDPKAQSLIFSEPVFAWSVESELDHFYKEHD